MSTSIEQLLFDYIKGIAELQTLLGGSSSNYKIYPVEAPDDAVAPYIVYKTAFDGRTGEIMKMITVMLTIVVPADYSDAVEIRDVLDNNLDVDDQISLSSSAIVVRNIVKNGGSPDSQDKDTRELIKVVNYDVLYTKTKGA